MRNRHTVEASFYIISVPVSNRESAFNIKIFTFMSQSEQLVGGPLTDVQYTAALTETKDQTQLMTKIN